ncbi:MAG: hypothetical protein RXR06_11580 [Thermoproteus sp.]
MILATYLPFYRIHEINTYFINNINVIQPKISFVFIDNVFNDEQKKILKRVLPDNIELKYGNWRNRNNTWIDMLKELQEIGSEALIVDSDNVIDSTLASLHPRLKSYPIYTVLDEEAWKRNPHHFLSRSRKISELDGNQIYSYKVFSTKNILKGGSMFFIGPKQVVAISKFPEKELLTKIERALNRVDVWLRNFISDETLLGVIAHLMGIEEVPWVVASHHLHHGSTPGKATEVLVAAAHRQFARGLMREFGNREFYLYYLKYSASLLWNLRNLF